MRYSRVSEEPPTFIIVILQILLNIIFTVNSLQDCDGRFFFADSKSKARNMRRTSLLSRSIPPFDHRVYGKVK